MRSSCLTSLESTCNWVHAVASSIIFQRSFIQAWQKEDRSNHLLLTLYTLLLAAFQR